MSSEKILYDEFSEEKETQNYMWVEKYRPRTLDDVILSDEYRRAFGKWIEDGELPHVLFLGRPGSGKTTISKILVNSILKSDLDLLYLNGSNQRGIGVVREQIEEFLRTKPYGSKIKIVFIDEFDYMTPEAQAALRNVIEEYSDFGRFVLTANYENKIIEAILSRVQIFRFKVLPFEYILDFCKRVLDAEGVKVGDKDLQRIVVSFYPDVRKIVNYLQSRSVMNNNEIRLSVDEYVGKEDQVKSTVLDIVLFMRRGEEESVEKMYDSLQKFLKENDDIDLNNVYEHLGFDERLSMPLKIIVAEFYSRHMYVPSPILNFMAMVSKMILFLRDEKVQRERIK